jgi:YbbR domain-containing protein
MKKPPILDRLVKFLPTFFTALILAIAVWVLAVTSTDPVQRRSFGRPVDIEIRGLNASLVITSELPETVAVTLSAPASIWASDLTSSSSVRAIADLSGVGPGEHVIPIRLQINARPVKIVSYTPDEIEMTIEEIYSEAFEIELQRPSSPAIGYEAGTPNLSKASATVKGPASLVDRVSGVRATLDVSQAIEDIDTNLDLRAVDENGLTVSGVTITPAQVNVRVEITQRGGYRNLPVKVVTSGQPKAGFSLTTITNDPLIVTVFSTDADLINTLPGFIETVPLDLSDATEDLVVSLPLNLPVGVTIVGSPSVEVSVTIDTVQGSRTLTGMPIETIGLNQNLQATYAPELVDIILSGPIPTLDDLIVGNVRVFFDLSGYEEGTYQLTPSYEVNVQGVLVQSILPSTVEVTISPAGDTSSN